jgi:hypothetical protein
MDTTITGGAPVAAAVVADDHPGRWLGGVIGGLTSLLVAVLLLLAERPSDDPPPVLIGSDASIALLGIPIAFALGRAAFPSIRAGRCRWALAAGVLIGLAAPPLGALEIVLGPFLLPIDPGTSDQLALVVFLPVALVFSYLAAWITIPVGLLTALAIRAMPTGLPERLRASDVVARFGVRHAIVAAVIWGIAIQAVTAVARE